MSDAKDLSDFDVQKAGQVDPSQIEMDCERFIKNTLPYVEQLQAIRIIDILREKNLLTFDSNAIEYGASFDLKSQVEGMIKTVTAMQDSILSVDGSVKDSTSSKEIKEVVTATSSLMNFLMKSHEKVMSFDRQRVLEQQTIATIRDMGGEEMAAQFVQKMEVALEN